MYAFKVPDIGEGVVEAEVLAWRVAEGDAVESDQILVELLTDKAEIEIPSPRAGRVHRIHFDVGDVARVGDVLIEIEESEGASASAPSVRTTESAPDSSESGDTSEEPLRGGTDIEGVGTGATVAPPDQPPRARSATPDRPTRLRGGAGRNAGPDESEGANDASLPRVEAPPRASGHAPPAMPERPRARVSAVGPSSGRSESVHAVPAVRELARRLGVDLERVRGTGPKGRIMRRDVEAHVAGGESSHADDERAPRAAASVSVETQPDDPEDWKRQPLRGLRRTIAERMVHARHTAAHFTYVDEVDMTRVLEQAERLAGPRLSPLAFIAHACVRALRDFPVLNASIDDARGEVVLKGRVHLGVAAATDQGLIVPVVRDAAGLDVAALAERIRTLADGARAGSLAPSDLRGSTFTITSLGKLGGVISTPILNWPEVAILGVNTIRTLPRVIEEQVVPRRVMNLSISVDHRIADGVVAAEYVQAVKEILERADFPELP